jgi:hypothetical protein
LGSSERQTLLNLEDQGQAKRPSPVRFYAQCSNPGSLRDRSMHAMQVGRSIRKKTTQSIVSFGGEAPRVQCTKLSLQSPLPAAPPDWRASPSYQCRSSSSSLNSILWRFYTPQLPPARQGREGAVGLLVGGQHLEQNGPRLPGFLLPATLWSLRAGRWRLSCLKFWLTQTL